MAAKVKNPRFPHTCTVYRMEGETSFEDGEKTVLYEGKCNKYGSSSLRTFKTSNVVKCDYAVDIPGLIEGIQTGDMVDATDYSGTVTGCLVTDAYATEMGTTVYFNLAKN